MQLLSECSAAELGAVWAKELAVPKSSRCRFHPPLVGGAPSRDDLFSRDTLFTVPVWLILGLVTFYAPGPLPICMFFCVVFCGPSLSTPYTILGVA